MNKELQFSFGAMVEPISKQYERQGYKLKNAEYWDKCVEYVIWLYIQNILTDSRYDEALNRIIKFSKKDAEQIKDE